MIIRKYFAICIVAVACLVATLCNSCSVEDPFSAGSYTYPMQVDAVLSGYDGASTRSGYDWPDGAKLYVQFYEGENRVQGFAEYNETNDRWTVTTRTGLSHVSNARCEAYYFGHSAETADVVELSENVAVYQDVAGSYICDANGLFVSLALTPRTGRIRFRGEAGRSFSVSGLTHLSTYETSSNNFSSTSKSLSLTVSEDGYTPYLYASFPEASRTMVIVDGKMEYTRECTESVLAIGKSGCMTIPTTTAHDGWTVDESAVADAIDLGLSVKWASCNVGADSPEEYGGYYAWGETETKDEYSENTYLYYQNKYVDLGADISGTEYDVAHVKWSDGWRMPTLDEINELCYNCSWNWTTQNGVNGYKVTGPNGNSIFLPAAGNRYGTEVGYRGSYGVYWSGTLHENNSNNAYCFYFLSDDHGWYSDLNRFYGHTVRPVYGAPKSKVSITTGDATDITDGGATLSGTVSNSDKSLTCGIIYGTSSTLSSTSGTMLSTTSSGEFSVSVTGLSASTTYYYCAYVVVDGEYKYGEVRSFTTEADISITVGEAVDLGLSVKWASCNIGAKVPENYGDYFAWGETKAKSSYTEDNSITYGLSPSELESRGIIGSDVLLTAAYDAATVNWGDKWRIPTRDEINELCYNCSWNWTTQNGVNGYKVTGLNGNSIFLPAAGYRFGTEVYDRGSRGCYWTDVLSENYGYGACYLILLNDFYDSLNSGHRSDGFTVRPVTK